MTLFPLLTTLLTIFLALSGIRHGGFAISDGQRYGHGLRMLHSYPLDLLLLSFFITRADAPPSYQSLSLMHTKTNTTGLFLDAAGPRANDLLVLHAVG